MVTPIQNPSRVNYRFGADHLLTCSCCSHTGEMNMCVLGFSSLHDRFSGKWGLTGVAWNGRPCGLMCMSVLWSRTLTGFGVGGVGMRWSYSILLLFISECDPACFLNPDVSLCIFISVVVILLYFYVFSLLMSTICLSHSFCLLQLSLPHQTCKSVEIIEWDSYYELIMSTVHMPDIKSHYKVRQR